MGVFGEKVITSLSPPSDLTAPQQQQEVLATFSDGSPAEVRFPALGQGKATVFFYHPGLAYFHPATPRRPVDRNAHIDSFTNFIPTEFGDGEPFPVVVLY